MKRCMYCGNENEDSAQTCAVCGNPLPDRPDGQGGRMMVFDDGPDLHRPGEEDRRAEASAPPVLSVPADAEADAEPSAPVSGAEAAEGADAPAAGSEAAEEGKTDEAEQAESAVFVQQQPLPTEAEWAVNGPSGEPVQEEVLTGPQNEAAGAAEGQTAADVPAQEQASGEAYVRDFWDGRPEGTVSGQLQGRRPAEGGQEAQREQDFAVGRGQTYGARQQAQAQGTRPGSDRDRYGSAGYGYRQTEREARRTSVRTAGGGQSKNVLLTSRRMVKGFLFFMMTLFFTAMVAANMCNLALPSTLDPSVSNAYLNLSNADTAVQAVLGSSVNGFAAQLVTELAGAVVSTAVNVNSIFRQLGSGMQLGILLIFLVPNTLYALALWIMFFQTRRGRGRFGMGGYTMARVMMTLKFIVACLVLAVGLVISVYFVVVGASSAKFTSSFIQGLIMLIVMILLAVLVIMYYVQWMYILKCAKFNVRAGQDIGKLPGYAGVISIVIALIAAALMVPLAADDYLGIAARGSAALYFLFSGLWIFVYRGKVKRA